MERAGLVEELAAEIKTWDRRFDSAQTIAECILDRLDQLGLVIVPREATEAMVTAGTQGDDDYIPDVLRIYRAMLTPRRR